MRRHRECDTAFAEGADKRHSRRSQITGAFPPGFRWGPHGRDRARAVRTFDPGCRHVGQATCATHVVLLITAQQELGRDRSTIKASITGVERDLESGSALEQLMARRAYTGLIDGRWRWARGAYDISAFAMFSHIEGDSTAMLRQQRSSRRYFQRPDAGYVAVQPGLTEMNGVGAGINHSKMAGDWLWDIDYSYTSPTLELNDIGFLNAVDDHVLSANVRFRETSPGTVFRRWEAGLSGGSRWNVGGVRNAAEVGAFGELVLKNFWSTDLTIEYLPRSLDDAVTRGGPLMQTARRTVVEVDVENPDGATTGLSFEASASRDELGGWGVSIGAGVLVRAGTRGKSPSTVLLPRTHLAANTSAHGRRSDPTFGSRYLFAEVERSEVSLQLRTNYSITPDLTLEGYLEPFASSGRYGDIGELARANGFDLRRYGTDGTTLVRDAEATWRSRRRHRVHVDNPTSRPLVPQQCGPALGMAAGSTAYLVWQQDRFEERVRIATAQPGGLLEAFGAPGANVLALKVSYWIAR